MSVDEGSMDRMKGKEVERTEVRGRASEMKGTDSGRDRQTSDWMDRQTDRREGGRRKKTDVYGRGGK